MSKDASDLKMQMVCAECGGTELQRRRIVEEDWSFKEQQWELTFEGNPFYYCYECVDTVEIIVMEG